jgi:hypothetical protein
MPDVRCVLEFDYIHQKFPIPAGQESEYEFHAPEGYTLISWGYTSFSNPDVRMIAASITPSSEGPRFIGIVQHDGIDDTTMVWTFVLLKD